MFQVALPGQAERQVQKPCELTSSIVPRGTSFPPLGGTRASSYLFASHLEIPAAGERKRLVGLATARICPELDATEVLAYSDMARMMLRTAPILRHRSAIEGLTT
jgi:hypothetical protein